MENSSRSRILQILISLGVLLVAGVLAWGARDIPDDAGYAGVGPSFLPWGVALALALCGGLLLRQTLSGGFRDLEEPPGAPHGDWGAFAWLAAGVLLNAALIEHVGFVLSCALCFALAVRGLRQAEGQSTPWPRLGLDLATGVVIAAPVYWMFTQLLSVNLPGLTGTGWF